MYPSVPDYQSLIFSYPTFFLKKSVHLGWGGGGGAAAEVMWCALNTTPWGGSEYLSGLCNAKPLRVGFTHASGSTDGQPGRGARYSQEQNAHHDCGGPGSAVGQHTAGEGAAKTLILSPESMSPLATKPQRQVQKVIREKLGLLLALECCAQCGVKAL